MADAILVVFHADKDETGRAVPGRSLAEMSRILAAGAGGQGFLELDAVSFALGDDLQEFCIRKT